MAKALRWMWRSDAPLYVKPRMDIELAAWMLRFAARCNARDWRRSALARASLLNASRGLVESLVVEQQLECEFRACGLRYVYATDAAFEKEVAGLDELRQFGIDSRVIGGSALAAEEPALLPGLSGAVHFPGDAHFRPEQFNAELARIVRAQGGEIEEQVAVESMDIGAGRVTSVATSAGARSGRSVLVALGPWSAPMLARHGIRLPIQPGKGYSQTYSRPDVAPKVPMVLREHSVCVTAWDSGFRLGSTMEFSGYDNSLNRTRLDALEQAARRYLRHPIGEVRREEWCGWRPMTVDDLPILGLAPRHDNLWLATGHGMMGMTLSAVTGRLMADLISGAEPIVDPQPSSPLRFS
jgi:D-amino-acid dehydrogenase